MAGYILLFVVIILICLILHNTSSKLGIPMLLAFIVLGMIFGSDGLVKLQFDDYVLAQQVCSVALIFIMFYGGYGTSWKSAKPVATKAILLSSVGVILTALLVGLFSFFVLHIDFWESMLIGSVIVAYDTMLKHHCHGHTHTVVHTHNGVTHTHVITHAHGHNHFVSEEQHGHNHGDYLNSEEHRLSHSQGL